MDTDRSREPTPFDEDEYVDRDADGIADDEYPASHEAELELGNSDSERLPWLEGDDEDYEEGGSGQLIMFVLGGLLLLGLLVGGIWFLTRDRDGGEMVADGSVIEAPDGPYKERPIDPQGKTFEGTGDSSFAVSEGQERPAQLDTGEGAATPAAPGFDNAGADSGAASTGGTSEDGESGAAAAAPAESNANRVGVQVGAYSSRAKAEEAWSTMKGQVSALSGASYRIVEGNADIGKVYRLQALAADRGAANRLCNALKSAGRTCIVK